MLWQKHYAPAKKLRFGRKTMLGTKTLLCQNTKHYALAKNCASAKRPPRLNPLNDQKHVSGKWLKSYLRQMVKRNVGIRVSAKPAKLIKKKLIRNHKEKAHNEYDLDPEQARATGRPGVSRTSKPPLTRTRGVITPQYLMVTPVCRSVNHTTGKAASGFSP